MQRIGQSHNADDGYINAPLSVALRILADLKQVFKDDAGLELITLASFTAGGYVGLGVPLGTDAFVQKFVHDACQKVIDDDDKLDHIEDGFVHYQLLRFCQATRLQYLNSHVSLDT